MCYLFAIGGNDQAATMTGVPVRLMKVVVCMLSSLSAGIAGIVQTGWLGAVTTNIGAGLEMQVIAAVVVGGTAITGGRGTMFGTLVGVLLLGSVRPTLSFLGLLADWDRAAQGAIILLAVGSEAIVRLPRKYEPRRHGGTEGTAGGQAFLPVARDGS